MGAQGTLGAAAPVQRPGRLHAARECAAIQSAKTGAHASPCCENYSIPERWQGRPCPAIHHRRPTTRAALLNHQARTFWCAALRSAVYPYVSRIHPHPDSAAGTHNIVQILGRVSTCFLLKLLLIPPCRGLCWKRDCGGDANEKDGAAGRPRFRRRAGIGRRFGGEFSASC